MGQEPPVTNRAVRSDRARACTQKLIYLHARSAARSASQLCPGNIAAAKDRQGGLIVVGSRRLLIGLLPGRVTHKAIGLAFCPRCGHSPTHSVQQTGARPSHTLPEAGLLVEAIQFYAAEVEARNDPDYFAIVNDRQMAAAAVFHEAERVDR